MKFNRLTKTPYLVLFILLGGIGVGTAYAFTITLAGDVFVDGTLGVGTIAPGATLDVNGDIAIRGGQPGTGKVLTDSDGSGLAQWQDIGINTTVATGVTAVGNLNEGMTTIVVETFCSAGQVATGGGCDFNGQDNGQYALRHSTPLKGTTLASSIAIDGETPTGWACKAVCSGDGTAPDNCQPETLRAFVICTP